ncbi:MAG TPA: acyl-ACP desaturase [Acidimicrobiales bacterium]
MVPDGFLHDLAPVAGQLLERHLSTAKEWFPHELVPWSRGRDFEPGEAWQAEDDLPDAVRSALFVNLLTEDNLPYYLRTISRMFSAADVWGEWAHRWTAEEGRHAIVIRDYLVVTRAVDPVALERGRMSQVSGAKVPEPAGPANGVVYVALQELATRIAHRNTGKLLSDRAGYDVMARVAADENLHYLFYRDLATAAFERDPSEMVIAVEQEVREFEMPGTGIPDFGHHAMAIARAGIYDLAIHADQILVPVVLRHWGLEGLEGLTPEAEQARDRLVRHIERVRKAGHRLAARRAEREQALAATG